MNHPLFKFFRNTDVAMGLGVIFLMMLIVMPLSAVFLDLYMPNENSFDVIPLLREAAQTHKSTVSILSYTGSNIESDHRRALEAGCDSVLVKPLELVDVASALNESIQESSSSSPAKFQMLQSLDKVPSFNEEAINRIRQFSDVDTPSVFQEMITTFHRTAPLYVARIRNSLSSRNLKEVARQAHPLISTSRYLGLERIAWICTNIDHSIGGPKQPPDLRQLHQLSDQLLEELRNSKFILEEKLKSVKELN
jgi:CheY-like chemotaxis protein